MNANYVKYVQCSQKEDKQDEFENRFPYPYLFGVVSPSVMNNQGDTQKVDAIVKYIEQQIADGLFDSWVDVVPVDVLNLIDRDGISYEC